MLRRRRRCELNSLPAVKIAYASDGAAAASPHRLNSHAFLTEAQNKRF
jgi:hypothetical protein